MNAVVAYPVRNVACRLCGQGHDGLSFGQKRPPPPGVCCQATEDGGVVCSDGTVFPSG